MKNLPIDTSGMTMMCADLPQPVVDFETKRPKADENGVPLFSVQLVMLHPGGADIIPVRIARRPSGQLRQGTAVKVHGLAVTQWAMGDRSGVSFRADRIELVPASPASSTSKTG